MYEMDRFLIKQNPSNLNNRSLDQVTHRLWVIVYIAQGLGWKLK